MKKLTKATALVLSAIMLFGCADGTQSNSSDTAQPSESSATESKTDSSETGGNTSNSETSEDTRNYNLVENKEGYQTFSYDPEKHTILNETEYVASRRGFYEGSDVGYEGQWPFDPTPEGFRKSFSYTFEPIAVKCHVAGDSYVFQYGKCGEVQVFEQNKIGSYCSFTPVVIEEIIDTFDYDCTFKEGDIVYVKNSYGITDPYNELSLKKYKSNLESIKMHFEDESGNFDSSNHSEDAEIYYKAKLEYYDKILNGNGKYIVNGSSPVILQKGQSYLMLLNNKKNTPNEVDGNIYNKCYPIPFDLENDEPTVYKSKEEDEIIFYFGKCYPYQWKYLKEKYGEHFKN